MGRGTKVKMQGRGIKGGEWQAGGYVMYWLYRMGKGVCGTYVCMYVCMYVESM